jgi:plastocyanin
MRRNRAAFHPKPERSRWLVGVCLAVAWIFPERARAAPSIAATVMSGLVGQGPFGTIKGRLVWGGPEAPTPKVLQEKGTAQKNPDVCAKNQSILSQELVVDPKTKGIAYAFAYLPRPKGTNPDAVQELLSKHSKVELDQKNCEFLPHAMTVHQDQTVVFKSSDPTNHNVRLAGFANSMNQTLASQGRLEVKVVRDRFPVEIKCDIHPWMRGWMMVYDHPFFATTGSDGSFEIKGVPAGEQNLVVWQETVGFVTPGRGAGMTVTVRAGEVTDVGEITLDPAKVKLKDVK